MPKYKVIFGLLIFSIALVIIPKCFAEDYNALNITIYNESSGEILYNKIIPNNEYFHDVIYYTYNGNKYSINITVYPNLHGYSKINTPFPGNWTICISSDANGISTSPGGLKLTIIQTSYDFNKNNNNNENNNNNSNNNENNSDNNNNNNTTKSPLPIGVYLIIPAIITYILCKKSKNY